MVAGLLMAGAAGLVALLLARGMPRQPEEPSRQLMVQEQPQVTTAVAPAGPPVAPAPVPLVPPPAPRRFQILEVYLYDQYAGSTGSTFSVARVMQRTSLPAVRYRVHVLEELGINIVVSVAGFVLGQRSDALLPTFNPLHDVEINLPSTPGTYQLQVLFSGANYEEARSLSLTIVP